MEIEVREANRDTTQHLYQVDGSLWVDSRLVLSAEDGKIHYTVTPIAGYSKPYEREELNVASYLSDPDRAIYFAYADGKLAGQIILRKNWNLFAWVDDIAVEWAESRNLPGIMLETQDVRVAACRFYERFGFELGGFDRLLYKAALPGTEEIALFWYLQF